ncbi:MAG: hypothetical protein ACI31W_04780 [Lactococcus sp.]
MNKKIIILSTLVIAIYIIYRIIGTHLNWYVFGGLSAMLICPIVISDKKEKMSLLVTLFSLISVNVFYLVLNFSLKVFMNFDFYIWVGFVYSCLFLNISYLRTLKYSK